MKPRVHQILKAAGLVDGSFYTDFARDRGAAVHAACALDDLGDLVESTVHPEVAPYLRSWRLGRQHFGWKFQRGDVELSVETASYTGHPDKVLRSPDRKFVTDVIDLKAGQPERWHSIQLAFYAMAFLPAQSVYPARIGVYLKSDGTMPNVVRYTDPEDFRVAKAALTVAAWITNGDWSK